MTSFACVNLFFLFLSEGIAFRGLLILAVLFQKFDRL